MTSCQMLQGNRWIQPNCLQRPASLSAFRKLHVQHRNHRVQLHATSQAVAVRPRERSLLQGRKDWVDLFQSQQSSASGPPKIDQELRQELIKYGELTQITYDSFYGDKHDKNTFGKNKYKPEKLFERILLDPKSPLKAYTAHKYFYAESGMAPLALDPLDLTPKSRYWQGYAAVSKAVNGKRDVVFAWRGTIAGSEWVMDAQTAQVPYWADDEEEDPVSVAAGFSAMYLEAVDGPSPQEQVEAFMTSLWKDPKLKDEIGSISVCGHSLGGALAQLCAFDLGASELNKHPDTGGTVPITAYTFCSPRVGNDKFAQKMAEFGVKVLRTVNRQDIVHKVPGLSEEELDDWKSNVAEVAADSHLPPDHSFGMVQNLHPMESESAKNAALERTKETLRERLGKRLKAAGTAAYRAFEKSFRIVPYAEVGTELALDSNDYPEILKRGGDLKSAAGRAHNLECLMHLIDPKNRDKALCNKTEDALIESLYSPPIPARWFTSIVFKGMELGQDGKWTLVHEPYSESEEDKKNFPAEEKSASKSIFGRWFSRS